MLNRKRLTEMCASVSPPPRLGQQYVYPQTFLQPSLLLHSHLSPTAAAALTSPYLDYSSAYSPYASTGLEQYPYTPSPSPSAGYLSYSFSPSTPAPAITASPTPPSAIHPPLAALTAVSAAPQAFLHYPLHQPDRMQWAGLQLLTWWVKNSMTVDLWHHQDKTGSGRECDIIKRAFQKHSSSCFFFFIIIIIIVVIVKENVLLLLSSAYTLNVFHQWQQSETEIRRLVIFWMFLFRRGGHQENMFDMMLWLQFLQRSWAEFWALAKLGLSSSFRNTAPITSSSRLTFCLWP